MEKDIKEGLNGVIVGKSKISTVGLSGGLTYRGYSIKDLSENCIFEEVAFLLLYEKLPDLKELNIFKSKINKFRNLPFSFKRMLENTPQDSNVMLIMTLITNFAGLIYPERNNDPIEKCIFLLGTYGPAMCYWYHYHFNNKRIDTKTLDNDTISENFLKLLLRKDNLKNDLDKVNAFDVSLILYAEHDFAASTFAARVTASTQSDFYSSIMTGIGTLKGNLHGGANEAAMKLLENFNNIDEVQFKMNDFFNKKVKVMGFGHRIYKNGDPRHYIIKNHSKILSEKNGNKKLYNISCKVEEIMINKKKIYPNLDFFAASCYNQIGVPTFLFTPIFVISRCTGWTAHIIEQRKNNKLIRPKSFYNGPNLKRFIPISQRNNQKL